MPKQVDHEARRQQLLEALWRINRRQGWDAISLRKVAAEAGVSMGMVQHYFVTKDQMLRFALEMMADDTRRRIRERVARLPQPTTPRELVENVLTEMIPDASRRVVEAEAGEVWMRRFLLRPESRAALGKGGLELRAVLAEQIRLSRGGGDADVDADRDAAGLIALLDGLIYNMVVGQETTESAVAVLQRQLDYVFGSDRR